MSKKTLKQAVDEFVRVRKRGKPGAPVSNQLWTRPDLIFADPFAQMRGAGVIEAPPTRQPEAPKRRRRVKEHQPGSPYSVQQAAVKLGVGHDKIREWFRNEAGVIRLTDEKGGKKGKRKWVGLRIPEDVFQRVKRLHSAEGRS